MSLQAAFEKHQDDVDFYWVYINEAHSLDDARPSATTKIHEPKTIEERIEVAGNCSKDLGLEIPQLIDDMEDTVSIAYSAHPDRVFILGADGKIAFTGGKGPHDFDVPAMVEALEEILAAE